MSRGETRDDVLPDTAKGPRPVRNSRPRAVSRRGRATLGHLALVEQHVGAVGRVGRDRVRVAQDRRGQRGASDRAGDGVARHVEQADKNTQLLTLGILLTGQSRRLVQVGKALPNALRDERFARLGTLDYLVKDISAATRVLALFLPSPMPPAQTVKRSVAQTPVAAIW